MMGPAYKVELPHVAAACVVFASPHSGRDYTRRFLGASVLDSHTIRSSEDAFVDQLFSAAPEFGAPLLCATAPRAFVDLNRAPDEFDGALVTGVRNNAHNPRVASGLGVIPRVVSNGRAIYRGKMSKAEAEARIAQYWHPYHDKLRSLLTAARSEFGRAILVDCHSMPHEALDGVAKVGMRRPDIVLGDRFGSTASADVVDRIESAFKSAGFAVARNAPFAGAYITQAYGRPSLHQHAVQIEIDRSIYMDERAIRPNSQFEDVRLRLRRVIAEVTEIGKSRMPLAAE
ncbi:MAG: N-formylglutamate amidohydrolase [Paracoccaceae bacterium]